MMVEKRKRHAKKSGKAARKKAARITVYVSPRDIACNVLLEVLETPRVPHQARDIARDAGAKQELAQLTGGKLSVPVVQIGETVLRNPNWVDLVTALATCPLEDARPDRRDLSSPNR